MTGINSLGNSSPNPPIFSAKDYLTLDTQLHSINNHLYYYIPDIDYSKTPDNLYSTHYNQKKDDNLPLKERLINIEKATNTACLQKTKKKLSQIYNRVQNETLPLAKRASELWIASNKDPSILKGIDRDDLGDLITRINRLGILPTPTQAALSETDFKDLEKSLDKGTIVSKNSKLAQKLFKDLASIEKGTYSGTYSKFQLEELSSKIETQVLETLGNWNVIRKTLSAIWNILSGASSPLLLLRELPLEGLEKTLNSILTNLKKTPEPDLSQSKKYTNALNAILKDFENIKSLKKYSEDDPNWTIHMDKRNSLMEKITETLELIPKNRSRSSSDSIKPPLSQIISNKDSPIDKKEQVKKIKIENQKVSFTFSEQNSVKDLLDSSNTVTMETLNVKTDPLTATVNNANPTKKLSLANNRMIIHPDGSLELHDLDTTGKKQTKTVSANEWINDKNLRKEAIALLCKNEPNSELLKHTFLSKLGQPMAGGKIGRTIGLLDKMTVVSYVTDSGKILWKVTS